jgi:hypothetical protein
MIFIPVTKYVHIKSTTVYAPRRNWDSPQPPTRRLMCPLPPVSGGRGTLAGEKGVGRVPIPTRGIHCGTLNMYVLCDSCYTLSVTRWLLIFSRPRKRVNGTRFNSRYTRLLNSKKTQMFHFSLSFQRNEEKKLSYYCISLP